MPAVRNAIVWIMIGLAGAGSLGVIALHRGETLNAVWLIVAAACTFLVAYRFYARFLARRVLGVDPSRVTPAVRRSDGLDYVPTNRYIAFGHHFAAIAGAGPLVGPVLAAQLGYLPGTLWIIVGAAAGGAVQDLVVLFLSMRRDGRSLGEMIRLEMGNAAGTIAMLGVLLIMIILLAVLALVVLKALAGSPWGTFTVFATLPIAVLMGLYLRFLRPGRVLEVSLIGLVLLFTALALGKPVSESPVLAPLFTLRGETLALILIGYGFFASVLPVWLILAPRDYLSTFMKVGTILALAVGILIVMPDLQMPSTTRFMDGTGPVFAGGVFPFLFVTIACGAVSGFHALIASGTTPKLIASESDMVFIGYGAMLVESFVAIMALIAACVLTPGAYFAMNSAAALIGHTPAEAAAAVSSWGFSITPDMLANLAREVGEQTILSRTGGAPTLAVGMAQIFSSVFGGARVTAFWYHFAILFEALFILTTVDAGTRVARFMVQDLLGSAIPALAQTRSWMANILATAIAVGAWGYFLYRGVIDPLGGVNTLWPLFGISNQMLAAIALTFCSVALFKMKRERYAWTTLAPAAWLIVCTLTAGLQKIFHPDPAIGFLAHARRFSTALSQHGWIAPAKSAAQMRGIIINDWVDAALCVAFVIVVVATAVYGLRSIRAALGERASTAREWKGPGDSAPASATVITRCC